MSYYDSLANTVDALVTVLSKKGIEKRYLNFGGPGIPATKKPTVPTDARSEFLANRAMGDWAEDILAASIKIANPEWDIIHYGNAERMAAGDVGFKEFYLGALEEVRLYGKRPDLLVCPVNSMPTLDMSGFTFEEVDSLVSRAIASIEVRSSKFEAQTYMRVRKEQAEAGNPGSRDTPSFTVKVEDLKIVYRWIERYGIPQSYCQVFFDSVYAINFLDIFVIISSGTGFSIESPAKSQEKSTIMIPITRGSQVGTFVSPPDFKVQQRTTILGRRDAYVVPIGGDLRLDIGALAMVLLR